MVKKPLIPVAFSKIGDPSGVKDEKIWLYVLFAKKKSAKDKFRKRRNIGESGNINKIKS